jgi:hypothetical protein
MASLEQGDVAATNFAEFRTETSDEHDADWQFNWPEGTKRTVLSTDPETGATTFLLQLPPGYHPTGGTGPGAGRGAAVRVAHLPRGDLLPQGGDLVR